MAGVEQWVNLPKKAGFVEDEISSQERLDAAHVECSFEKANPADFRVKTTPDRGNLAYTAAEMGRNPNFRLRVIGRATNDGAKNVKLQHDIFLPAAGGNEYKVEAKYKKKTVESGKTLKARRKLFFQVMRMRSITAGPTAMLVRAFWQPDKKFFIKMKQVGPVAEMDHTRNLDDSRASHNALISAAARKWKLASRKPFCFAVAFVEYICAPADIVVRQRMHINVPSKLTARTWTGEEMTIQLREFLWFGLNPADDRAKRWLVDGKLVFKPDGAAPGVQEAIRFNRDDVAVAGPDHGPHGGKSRVKVRIREGAINRSRFWERAGTWHVELKLRIADNWSGGFAYTQINLLAIATRAFWKDKTRAEMAQVINHEIGHKVGMVATGRGRLPNAPPRLYGQNRGVNDQDHRGPHCSKGATWDATKPRGQRWSGAPQCVMFGSNGISNRGGRWRAAPAVFCADCAAAVRKLDLSANTLRMQGFQYTLDEI